jgi:hypothetical protein
VPYRKAAQPLPDSEESQRDDDERVSIPPAIGKAIPRPPSDPPIEAGDVAKGALVGLAVFLVPLIFSVIMMLVR